MIANIKYRFYVTPPDSQLLGDKTPEGQQEPLSYAQRKSYEETRKMIAQAIFDRKGSIGQEGIAWAL